MRKTPSGTGYSATDLSAFLECSHRTALDLAVLSGRLQRPGKSELERRLLEMRGGEHERKVLEHYEVSGANIVTIASQPGAEGTARAIAETLEAMSGGAEIIYQAVLSDDTWSGRPDFLVKIDGTGGRWRHHYEVVDAKLAREAKARAVLQLCVYTDQLARIQGIEPRYFHIATGGGEGKPLPLRAHDYMSYYRAVRARFEDFVTRGGPEPYPEPVEHCAVCPWWKRCEERRRSDDHLSLVANITRRQRDRLSAAGVTRVTELAAIEDAANVDGIAPESLERVRHQARLQVRGRAEGRAIYELLTNTEPGTGLEALPVPTPGDLFLDLEGDSFVGGEGLEYLFGLLDFGEPGDDFTSRDAPGEPRYFAFWALDRAAEKRAFERVIDRIVAGREEFSRLHVFHFGHREADALKRLSCRHKTREEEVDQLLRDHVLVDLHPIVRHSLRASVEGYTLKQLEALHGFERKAELRSSAQAMHVLAWWLETQDPEIDVAALRARIEAYNRDDCFSTWKLREFLEGRRKELEKLTGRKLGRPEVDESAAAEERAKKNDVIEALARRLVATDDPAHRLLADLLDWHWREAKSGWWEYHRARELAPEDRLEDRAVLAGLVYDGVVGTLKQSIVHRYRFPPQEHAIRAGDKPIDPDTQKIAGEVVELREDYVDLRRGKSSKAPHPTALIPGKPIPTDAHEASLLALGEALAAGDPGFGAARDVLRRSPPRAGQAPGTPLVQDGESIERALSRLAFALDGSVFAVQGPPGSGKTYQAGLMILELLRAKKRVGVTANSHAVIDNLLRKVMDLARGSGVEVRALHVRDEYGADGAAPFEIERDKAKVARRLAGGELDLVGGTSWVWAHEQFASSLDLLVIDEAGQMSLANVLAVSRAAENLVLFGDPAQLDQPQKGVHPPGADASALEHLLGEGELTLPPDRGVFIPRTRRMHPAICDFVSKVFYEGRLHPEESLGLENQRILGPEPFAGAGLRYLAVEHRGNTNQSLEEVAAIRDRLQTLLASSPRFVDRQGVERPLTADDVLVVAPYNAQVAALRRALPGIKVGTVDKFQGQEAPIVVYSMTTSSAEDAPRGLEFLYSLNRLNVAISRARAVALLVASPELSRVACKTPRQMKLVNALCAYLEAARG